MQVTVLSTFFIVFCYINKMRKEGEKMTSLNEILRFNEEFVNKKEYAPYITSKFPNKKIVVLTCMDTRLTELLPKAMNLRNGDAKIIKSAGAMVAHPFGGIMRSILVAVYALKAEEIYVIGHYDCGMSAINSDEMISNMVERGIDHEVIDVVKNSGIDLMNWLHGFGDIKNDVINSVNIIRNHPLIPNDTPVHGLVMDPATGKLDLLSNGYEQSKQVGN